MLIFGPCSLIHLTPQKSSNDEDTPALTNRDGMALLLRIGFLYQEEETSPHQDNSENEK
jgi:hypothetical protein